MEISKLVMSTAALNVIDNGAWVGDLHEDKSLELFVIGQNSEEAQKFIQAEQIAMRAANGGKPLTVEDVKNLNLKLLGQVIIKDHRGLTSGGKPLKFDREQVAAWVAGREGADFANRIALASNRIDADAESFVEAATKNSSPA